MNATMYADLDAKLRPFVERRVPRADIDDVMQDVFVRVQRGIAQLRDEDRVGPWVYAVTRSAIAEHHRARARHPLAKDDEVEAEDAPSMGDDDDREAERSLVQAVIPFISLLPTPFREALTLTEIQGLTQREAAELLGLSISGMKSRVQRGRAELRRLLELCCEIALDPRGKVVSCEPRPRTPEAYAAAQRACACSDKSTQRG